MPFATRVEREFSPLDEELELLAGRLSPALAEAVARLGAEVPFARGRMLLEQLAGARLSTATLRRHTHALGAAALAVEAGAVDLLEQGKTEPVAGPAHLQLSVDGAMVPLAGGTWAEVRTLATGELRPGRDGDLEAARLSYFSRLTDHATFTRLATLETHRRGVAQAGHVTTVNDGADWIQEFVDVHAPAARRVLDLSHAAGYVHAAGHALADGTCGPWCERQLRELVDGEPKVVLAELAALGAAVPTDHPASPTIEQSRAYLAKREAQIQYRDFRAAGLPIGSGIVESANKLVVEARLKGAGMHWSSASVNAILVLRCADLSDHWQTTAHLAQEHLRLSTSQRRRDRCLARRTAPHRRATRPPRILDGRPTAHHPWKRYPAVRTRHAKL